MNPWEKGIFFFSCLLDGMIVPVMSLVYLEHGASIENLALFIAIYSVTVIILEVPSGMIADLLGRKRVFLLAHIFLTVYYITTLLSHSAVLLVFANVFHGAGRAFSSGSLEALLIDKAIKKQGEEHLKVINSQMIVLNSIALAAGSILGGMLGTAGENYNVLLSFIIGMEALLFLCAGLCIKENRYRKEKRLTEGLFQQLNMMKTAMKSSVMIKILLFMSVTLAMNLTLVEVYWQQKLMHVLPENMGWFLGLVSCMGYVGLSVGSKIGEKIAGTKDILKIFWTFRILLPLVIILLGQSFHWGMFMLLYIFTYIVWGIGDLQEGTLFHQHVESEYRASMLSVKSLFVKGGCVVTSVMSSVIIRFAGLSYVWIVIPVTTMSMIFISFFTCNYFYLILK